MSKYRVIESGFRPIKMWTRGVAVEAGAVEQLKSVARLSIVYPHVAAMPDVHQGIGATVGSVIPTRGAVIPAAVGVDIGCGMMAVRTTLDASDLPDSLKSIRAALERAVPCGRAEPREVAEGSRAAWGSLGGRLKTIVDKHPKVGRGRDVEQLGSLGGGNHFIELCLDEDDDVWVMLHSGSRGVGNRIGRYFIEMAKADMLRHDKRLPDVDLAYFTEGTTVFDDYVEAVSWAQDYAMTNRELMMRAVIDAIWKGGEVPPFKADLEVVNCHHNYVAKEEHYGESLFVTRKGAVRARAGDLGIIPGSMGARSYIVRGLGNAESFHSCSHGAGRLMSRGAAKKRFSTRDHAEATKGIECRKDAGVLDETPGAYKPIDDVMKAQDDLVEIVHTLKQLVCIKG